MLFSLVIEVTIPKFHIPQLTRHSSIVFRNFNSANFPHSAIPRITNTLYIELAPTLKDLLKE